MADLDVSILTLCLPLWASALNMSASLISDKETAAELNLLALLIYLSIFVSLYLDHLRQRAHLQGIRRGNLVHRVLINSFTWVVPNGGTLFVFIVMLFNHISIFNISYLKMFWICVYFTFSGLLYIYGFSHSNRL